MDGGSVKLFLVPVIVGLVNFSAWASEIDGRESPIMVDALRHSGAQVTTGPAHQSIVAAKQMSCLKKMPAQGNPSTECSFIDAANGQKLPSYTSAEVIFDLVSHFGGTLTQGTQNGENVQNLTAKEILCTKPQGENEGWLCDVQN